MHLCVWAEPGKVLVQIGLELELEDLQLRRVHFANCCDLYWINDLGAGVFQRGEGFFENAVHMTIEAGEFADYAEPRAFEAAWVEKLCVMGFRMTARRCGRIIILINAGKCR